MQPTISITILFLAILSFKSNIYIVQCTSSYESNSPTLSPSDAPTSAASAADAPTSAAAADAPTSAAAADAPTSVAAADAPTSAASDAPTSTGAADAPTSAASDAPTSAATDGPTSAVADGPTLVASDGPTLAPSDAPSHNNNNVKDPEYITSPSSAPIAMQDADGDPINLPFSFNPFDPKQQQEAPLPKAVEPDVKKTCDATDNPDLCVSSLTPFLTNNNNNNNKEAKTDTLSLLEMQIKATLQATQHAIELSSSDNVGLSDSDMDSLRDCKELYDDAKDNLKHALEALSSKDIGTINSMLSAVVSDFSTCNDGFQESGNSSPMADYGNKLSQLVSNCLATVSLINNN